ncbi:alpha/beta hydrolase [Mesorhizobium sp. INR15]|uniref:alpha/beta hydrolase n=1 Tax=Mesorhizobium sp. INR15 TaxID=2654248 RepID=UPI0018969755|nr:alpha/beta hydrolase [Mesorhizobium sp. INR15]QPC91528.1 alpha/beta hydrolase fold domain-containing protein [Mesorhizobium sp. INR15]
MPTDPFRTRDHVPEFDDIVADIKDRSVATRVRLPMLADIAYGPHNAERLDLLFPRDRIGNLPVHIFIHGGYWRMFSKSDYSYIADTVTKAGAIAVVIEYALMPEVRMATIVDQVRRAKQWVLNNIAAHGGDPNRLTVSGHSAGAHLATFLFDRDSPGAVRSTLLLGGLYDLRPLQDSFLKPLIGITDEEVEAFSPMKRDHPPQTDVMILVGEAETQPFHLQASRFAKLLTTQGLAVNEFILEARNHMNSVRDLGDYQSRAGCCLARLIEGVR